MHSGISGIWVYYTLFRAHIHTGAFSHISSAFINAPPHSRLVNQHMLDFYIYWIHICLMGLDMLSGIILGFSISFSILRLFSLSSVDELNSLHHFRLYAWYISISRHGFDYAVGKFPRFHIAAEDIICIFALAIFRICFIFSLSIWRRLRFRFDMGDSDLISKFQ